MIKKYFTDDDGYKHKAEFTADDKPISDKKYDKSGKLIGESVYINGKFVGYKKYFTDDDGYKHEAEFTADDKPISDKKYDKQGIFKQASDSLKQPKKSYIKPQNDSR
ncbi:MAG: hypothetical protein MJ158_02410 [Alphaproteobacteria bacterium]|nr:hypothetical protein [Alphaproteobacteria bacterium]